MTSSAGLTKSEVPPAWAAARKRIEAQHAKGKLTARERIELLARPRFLRGMGHVQGPPLRRLRHGRPVGPGRRGRHRLRHDQRPDGLRVRQDFTVFGGSLSEAHAEKICKIMDHAMKGAPVIGLNDSGDAGSRRASPRSAAMPTCSSGTSWPPASSPRSR